MIIEVTHESGRKMIIQTDNYNIIDNSKANFVCIHDEEIDFKVKESYEGIKQVIENRNRK